LEKAFADDIKIRLLDEKNPPQGIAFDVRIRCARNGLRARGPPQEPSGADATAGKLAVGTGIVTKGVTLLREGELTLDFQAAA